MIIFLLGVIIGLLVALFLFWSRPVVERRVHQLQSKIKEKGAIIEPENEELSNWTKELPHE